MPNNKFERRQLFLTCFLTALYLNPKTRIRLKREWMLSDDELDALEIKSVPPVIFNMVVANEIRKQIGEASDMREFTPTENGLYLLNVPARFADCGVIQPIFDAPPFGSVSIKNPRPRNIRFLQVYRHAADTRPFILGSF